MAVNVKNTRKNNNESSRERSKRYGIYEGSTGRTIFNLVSGAFMAGFLKFLGASDSISGVIIALPVLASLIQFYSPTVIEKLKWKKKLVTFGSAIHRVILVLMVFIPLLPVSVEMKIILAGFIYFISFLSISFIVPAIANMYMGFLRMNERGKYFGKREKGVLIFSTVITLAMGKVLDIFKSADNQYGGYIILFSLILLLAVLNISTFLLMNEVRVKPSENHYKLKDVIKTPLQNKKFRKIIKLFSIWTIGLHFGAAYFGIYMVSKLDLTYTFITISYLISAIFCIIFAPIWGRYADNRGWTNTTKINLLIIGCTHVLWLFVYQGPHMYILIIILNIFSGIAYGGLNISLFNIQFDYMPKHGKTLYLGFNAAIGGIIGYTTALLSSFLVGLLGNWGMNLLGVNIGIIQIIFSVSGLIIIMGSIYAGKISKYRPS